MSTISDSKELDRIESKACRCLEPWLVGALFITSVALIIIGSVALPARMHELPWGFLAKIPMDQSILMLSIGAIGLGVSIWKSTPQTRKRDVDQVITQLREISDLKKRLESKLYYFPETLTLTDTKQLGTKETRFTLIRADEGTYYIKTRRKMGRGVQKTAYVAKSIKEDSLDQVRTVERNPPVNDELTIYDALKDCPHVVHCLAVVKDTDQKRSLILEMCPTTLKKGGGLAQDKSLAVFEDCLRGVAALHEAGFLHLDCHRGNLFIDAQGRGRLGDFGSSRSIASLNTEEGFGKMMPITGKNGQARLPLAMATKLLAPEIVQGIGCFNKKRKNFPLISGKADVWSLGNVLAKKLKPQSPPYKKLIECQEAIQSARVHQSAKPYFSPFSLKLGEHATYFSSLVDSYPPEPTNKSSVDYLIWKMLHPSQALRFTAVEAADYISHLRKILQDS